VPPKSSRLTQLAITTAPVVFVLLWSTGFIGARYGLPYIEPLTFLAVRMVFVVVLMALIASVGGARFPSRPDIAHSLAAGALVHGLYLGGVFTAISQGVPAGISALIPGLQPILTSTIANRFMGETVTRIQWLGLVLGLIGVVLVLHDRDIVMAGSSLGWFASFLSLIGITLGTLYQKRFGGEIEWRILAHAHTIEIVDDARGFSTVRVNRVDDVGRTAVVQKEQPLTDTPQRSGSELISVGETLLDSVAGTDVVNEQIRKELDDLPGQGRIRMFPRHH